MKREEKNKLTKRKVSDYVKYLLICIVLISMMKISGGCESSPTKQKNGDIGVIEEPGVITMVTTAGGVRLQFLPLSDITIEWGDGNETKILANQTEVDRIHIYEHAGPHSITIIGDLLSFRSHDNRLTYINTENSNTKLQHIDVSHNQIESIDLSQNTSLRSLSISNNKLTSLDISKNKYLRFLNASNSHHYSSLKNQISYINLQNNPELRYLYLSRIGLKEIDLSYNRHLIILNLSDNNLQSIDVTNQTELVELYLSQNNLQSIDLTSLIGLVDLNLSENNIQSIDVTNLTELVNLILHNNKISEIDISKNIVLIRLNLSENQLKSLCTKENVRLSAVSITNNNFYEEEINRLFGTLQDGGTWGPRTKGVHIGNNPGTDSCDRSIATNRRWVVFC